MLLVVFRSRLKPEHAAEYAVVAARINALAASMPGFLGIKSFTATDGERVSISSFVDEASLKLWREHPEHLATQMLGREKFYSEYSVQVCRIEREYAKVLDSPDAVV